MRRDHPSPQLGFRGWRILGGWAVWAVLGGAFLGPAPARATDELRELYRGPRAQAMGGASVAVVEDEEAIFLNPAGLAGVEKMTLNMLDLQLEGSTDTYASVSALSKFNNFNSAAINSLMGKDIYGRATITPSLVLPNLGVALLSDAQVALYPKNQQLPTTTLGYQFTNGFQAAYGMSVLNRGRHKGGGRSDLRIGIGGKMMWRRGGYHDLSLSDMLTANQNTINNLTGSYGLGYGFDLGMQYLFKPISSLTLSAGAAWTEIGDMKFASEADKQPGNLSIGFGVKYKVPRITTTLAYDIRHLTADTDPRKRQHLGFSIALPIVTIYGGLNQLNLTYGAAFDFWLIRLTALTYSEEIATLQGQESEKRYQLQIQFKF